MTSLGESGFGRGEYGSDTGAYDGVGLSSRGFVGCSASNRSGDDSSPGNEGVGADDIPWSGEERRDGVRLSSSGFAGSSSGAARPIDQAMINDGVGADDIPWSDEEHRDGVRLSSSGVARSSSGAARPRCQLQCLTGIRAQARSAALPTSSTSKFRGNINEFGLFGPSGLRPLLLWGELLNCWDWRALRPLSSGCISSSRDCRYSTLCCRPGVGRCLVLLPL